MTAESFYSDQFATAGVVRLSLVYGSTLQHNLASELSCRSWLGSGVLRRWSIVSTASVTASTKNLSLVVGCYVCIINVPLPSFEGFMVLRHVLVMVHWETSAKPGLHQFLTDAVLQLRLSSHLHNPCIQPTRFCITFEDVPATCISHG